MSYLILLIETPKFFYNTVHIYVCGVPYCLRFSSYKTERAKKTYRDSLMGNPENAFNSDTMMFCSSHLILKMDPKVS
jgi:hypothetical protein